MPTQKREQELPRKRSEEEPKPRPEPLKDDTRHGITVVVLFTLAALLLLSLFNLAGPLGNGIDLVLTRLLGSLRYLVPVVLLLVGYVYLVPGRITLRTSSYVGLVLFTFSSTALLHLTVPQVDAISAIVDGRGGGYIGLTLSYPLRAMAGGLASGVILVALFIIAMLVMFNTTLEALASRGTIVGDWYATLRSWWYRVRYKLDQRQSSENEESDETVEEDEAEESEDPSFASRDVAAVPLDPATAEQGEMFPEAIAPRKRRKIEIPLDLLETSNSKPAIGQLEEKKERIRKTLENFGIVVEMGDVNVGPTVTQFTLKPAEGVKLSQITTLLNDLSLALAAHPIRIEAPIPGKSLVGIELPNETVAVVPLRDILDSDGFKKRKSNLSFSLGKDVAGKPIVTNLDPMPHLLIAGATGSGKSVMMNSLILSLLYANSPDDLKMILVDPKRVEFSVYNNIPHLLTPVITETPKTVNALRWVVGEMDRRYKVLSNSGKRNIASYREEVAKDMPYLVIIIDELADLMTVAAQEVESAIIRLAQMARAVGIHLVLATQRPSVNVITGLIKANITARIAFNVASAIDSRTILDISGAEKLLGKGDMLFVSSELSKPKRLQAAFVSDAEILRVVNFLKERAEPEFIADIVEKPVQGGAGGVIGMDDLSEDELLGEAKELILRAGKASASLLQRRLRVGYARAARLLDLLEERGIIGPGDGAKPREILISREGYVNEDVADENTSEESEGEETETEETESEDEESTTA